MIDEIHYFDDVKLWLFNYDNSEWERVRKLCLEENNRLTDNYTVDKCKISDHKVFFICYKNNEPIIFGGLKEYNNKVARVFNRFYIFPHFRSSKIKNMHRTVAYMIKNILPIIEYHFAYPLIFISMQMRSRTYSGNQQWSKIWKSMWFSHDSNWKDFDGLVLTTSKIHKEGFQNIIYKDSPEFTFDDWTVKKLSFQQYEQLYNDS